MDKIFLNPVISSVLLSMFNKNNSLSIASKPWLGIVFSPLSEAENSFILSSSGCIATNFLKGNIDKTDFLPSSVIENDAISSRTSGNSRLSNVL